MDVALVLVVSAVVGGLTLVSGFGLGTLLMPVLALFMPLEAAIGSTAIVHLANNVFKLAVVGRWADRGVVIRFGVPAVLAAVVGAGVLTALAGREGEVGRWTMPVLEREARVTLVGLVVGAMVLGFGLLEPWRRFEAWRVPARFMALGGALSGFFGGLSGQQGALRSAFLSRAGLEARSFVGTGAVCSALVDGARLATYAAGAQVMGRGFGASLEGGDWRLVAAGCAGALVGVLGGSRVVKKVTMRGVRVALSVMMVVVGAGMMAGVV